MKLADLFEARAQEIVHHNPSVNTLKALARNNKYQSARFVITKDGDVVAADSEHYTHHSMAPYDGAWDVKGYVQYMGDGEYAYRSMEVYSALNKDHPILRIWERAGIENGNPDQSHLAEAWSAKYKKSINCDRPKGFSQRAHCAARKLRKKDVKSRSVHEHMVFNVLRPRQDFDLFYHTDRTLDDQVQFIEIDSNLNGFVIYKNQEVAAYLLLQEYQGNQWMLEAATMPKYRRQGLNSLLIDSAIKKHGRVFADMQLTPDSIQTLENYIKKTVYKVQRLDTETGDLHDYNPHDVRDQQLPMYDLHVPGVSRPAHSSAVKWVWVFSLAKPRNPLLMGYITAIESYHRPINILGEHDKVQKLTETYAPYNREYDAWIRYTPESLHADWREYVHKQDAKWQSRARMIGARWPLFSSLEQFQQALDQAPIVNVDDLGEVENLTRNHSLSDIKAMVTSYQNPRDVDRIVTGFHAQVPLPLPIILKGRSGMWIQAGNTRQATARVLGATPKALLVDVSAQP
jgi:ribosomal protein S18 acetylase RimI-like enzyme